ncbi:sugar transferase [Tsukamurella sp. 1534]|uniref:sugar transferase n=1 Tax=Tsukamurella sp. 1534 TaxID=1151061 RepID=UPI0003041259|nr:sugar transferase [Tsukamurella sp. 1534]
MSIDYMTGAPSTGSGPARVADPVVDESVAEAPRTVVDPDARAGRARLERAITGVDLMIAILAGAAGLFCGLAEHASAPVVLVSTTVAVAVWFHLLTRNAPLAVPALGMGAAELRRVIGTVRTVFGPLVVVALFFPHLLPRALVVVVGPVLLVGTLLSRLWWRRHLRGDGRAAAVAPTLVVGGYGAATATARALITASHSRIVGVCLPAGDAALADAIEVRGTRIPVAGSDREVEAAVRETGAGVVMLTATDALGPDAVRDLAWRLAAMGVELVVTTGLADVAGHRLAHQDIGGTPMVHVAHPRPRRSFGPGKRMLDLAVAGGGLAALAPVMLVIAIAIRVDSRGPVFYRAERIGADGRPFRMVKFRSMYVDADTRRDRLSGDDMGAGPLFKVKDDPRVTKVGRIIRRYSLDELPQFFNVLRGDMAVVGPRPALAHEVDQYPAVMRRRLLVKPGVTGAWQVSGRSDLSWDESIRIDVGYVENWSLGTDIGIIARTFRTVLTSDGAY